MSELAPRLKEKWEKQKVTLNPGEWDGSFHHFLWLEEIDQAITADSIWFMDHSIWADAFGFQRLRIDGPLVRMNGGLMRAESFTEFVFAYFRDPWSLMSPQA